MTDIVFRPRRFVPSEVQLQAITARTAAGSRKIAALDLGWSKGKLDYHLRNLLFGLRVHDDAQAAFVLRDEIAARMKLP